MELFKAALELEPEAAEIHQQMGLAYRKLGDLDAAREHLSKQASGDLSFPDPLMASLKGDFSRSHLFAGLEAQSTGRWEDGGRRVPQGGGVEDPTSGVNHQILATALERSGDLDSAIEEYRLAASLLPSDSMVRVQLAKALTTRDGVSDEAVGLFRRAVELAPSLLEARRGLAAVLMQQQRFDEVLEHLDAAVEIDADGSWGQTDCALEPWRPLVGSPRPGRTSKRFWWPSRSARGDARSGGAGGSPGRVRYGDPKARRCPRKRRRPQLEGDSEFRDRWAEATGRR